ncbi:hypothetical protein LXL04_030299 [Taraxacum kok-saghyz]
MLLYLAVLGVLSEEQHVVNEINDSKTSRGSGRGFGGNRTSGRGSNNLVGCHINALINEIIISDNVEDGSGRFINKPLSCLKKERASSSTWVFQRDQYCNFKKEEQIISSAISEYKFCRKITRRIQTRVSLVSGNRQPGMCCVSTLAVNFSLCSIIFFEISSTTP